MAFFLNITCIEVAFLQITLPYKFTEITLKLEDVEHENA